MALETESFTITGVEHKYAESREIRADRMRPPPQKVGYNAVTAACKACGKTSRLIQGRGLSPFIGGVILTCPFCGNEDKFTGRQLDSAA